MEMVLKFVIGSPFIKDTKTIKIIGFVNTTVNIHFRFEKYTDSDGRPRYAIAGYITVFQVTKTLQHFLVQLGDAIAEIEVQDLKKVDWFYRLKILQYTY